MAEMGENGSLEYFYEDECDIQPNDRRLYLAYAGLALSSISFITNVVIATVLLSSRHSHFFFLALLAISDCFLSIMYGPVIAMDIIKDHLQVLWVNQLYWWYIGPLLALCQTSMTFSCYLILLATIERYLITQRSSWLADFRRNRGMMAAFMFVLSIFLKGSMLFEVEVQRNADCTGLTEFVPGLSALVNTHWYGTVFRFYSRNVLTVMIPFFLLLYLNLRIVTTLRKQQRKAQMFRFLNSDHKVVKTKIRSASRLMVLVVFSYLIANILNVLITLWEYVAFNSTQTPEAYIIYEVCTDVISVLTLAACATRLLAYYTCNKEIRDLVRTYFCGRGKTKKHQKFALVSSNFDRPSRVGTELDAVAIAIARRLLSADLGQRREGEGPLQKYSRSLSVGTNQVPRRPPITSAAVDPEDGFQFEAIVFANDHLMETEEAEYL